MKADINKIETMGLADGPGIRTVIFFSGCKLRCKFCHNPETWKNSNNKYTVEELANKIIRNKPYFGKNGGVTFSGGEPLLHTKYLLKLCKKLKEENIHIAIDTAGITNEDYQELLNYIDLIILDVKSIKREDFINITLKDKWDNYIDFIKTINKTNIPIWIRQVIVPDINDNKKYIEDLSIFLKKNFKNIEKIELLPFHTMAFEKYKKENIKNPFTEKKAMDKIECQKLENYLLQLMKEA